MLPSQTRVALFYTSLGLTVLSIIMLTGSAISVSRDIASYNGNIGMVTGYPSSVQYFPDLMSGVVLAAVLFLATANCMMFALLYSDSRLSTLQNVSYDLVFTVYALLMFLMFWRSNVLKFALCILLIIVEINLMTIYIPYYNK